MLCEEELHSRPAVRCHTVGAWWQGSDSGRGLACWVTLGGSLPSLGRRAELGSSPQGAHFHEVLLPGPLLPTLPSLGRRAMYPGAVRGALCPCPWLLVGGLPMCPSPLHSEPSPPWPPWPRAVPGCVATSEPGVEPLSGLRGCRSPHRGSGSSLSLTLLGRRPALDPRNPPLPLPAAARGLPGVSQQPRPQGGRGGRAGLAAEPGGLRAGGGPGGRQGVKGAVWWAGCGGR